MSDYVLYLALLASTPSLWAGPIFQKPSQTATRIEGWTRKWQRSSPRIDPALEPHRQTVLTNISRYIQGALGPRVALMLSADSETQFGQSIDDYVYRLGSQFSLMSPENVFRQIQINSAKNGPRESLTLSRIRIETADLSAAGWNYKRVAAALSQTVSELHSSRETTVIKIPLSYLLKSPAWNLGTQILTAELPEMLDRLNDDRVRIIFTGTRGEWEMVQKTKELSKAFKNMSDEMQLVVFDLSRLQTLYGCETILAAGH